MKAPMSPWAIIVLLAAAPAAAHDKHNDHHDKHQSHDAHEHGQATLNLVVEQNTLLAELHTPAANIVGFEHAPTTQQQQQAVKEALAKLSQLDTLLKAPHGCTLHSADVSAPGMGGDNDHLHNHGHDHGHPHEEQHSKDQHAEFHVEYVVSCSNLSRIDIALMQHFPAIETVNTQWLTSEHQGYQRLTRKNTQLQLRNTN